MFVLLLYFFAHLVVLLALCRSDNMLVLVNRRNSTAVKS